MSEEATDAVVPFWVAQLDMFHFKIVEKS